VRGEAAGRRPPPTGSQAALSRYSSTRETTTAGLTLRLRTTALLSRSVRVGLIAALERAKVGAATVSPDCTEPPRSDGRDSRAAPTDGCSRRGRLPRRRVRRASLPGVPVVPTLRGAGGRHSRRSPWLDRRHRHERARCAEGPHDRGPFHTATDDGANAHTIHARVLALRVRHRSSPSRR